MLLRCYKPHSQNIFSYLGDLRKAIQRLHDINERLPEEGRIILPDSYVRSRLVRAARQVPIYKPVLDRLLIATVEEWSSITSEELYHQLEAVCANDQSVSAPKNAQATNFDSLSANTLQFKERSKEKEKKSQPAPCFYFSKGLGCSQNPCRFSHSKAPENKNQQVQNQNQPGPRPQSGFHSGPQPPANNNQHRVPKCAFCFFFLSPEQLYLGRAKQAAMRPRGSARTKQAEQGERKGGPKRHHSPKPAARETT